MIKFTKKATLYYNNQEQDIELEKRTFYTLDDALDYLKKSSLKYYINEKNVCIVESAEVLEIKHQQSESPTIKKYYKIIDKQTGEVITNIKES